MVRQWLGSMIFSLIGLSAGIAAQADRDIVYAARYYAPPGSHRTSHFHLYRINPDGTGRTQLTFGAGDEERPHWSADGLRVRFVEDTESPWLQTLCEVNANGGRRRVLKKLTDRASPEDLHEDLQTPRYRLENSEASRADAPDQHILIDLQTGRRQTLTVPEHTDLNDLLMPMLGGALVYAANNHNSTVGTDYLFYRLTPETGMLHYLTEGQFLAWSPDGLRFCTAPGQDTIPYQKRHDPFAVSKDASPEERVAGEYRLVWSAPLYIRATVGGPMRALTPRLSYVMGADWRRPPPAAPQRNR